MKISWFGHACFLIETDGTKIVTDPFDQALGYLVVPQEADIALISHDHWDHNALHVFSQAPMAFREEGSFRAGDIKLEGILSYHDKNQGQERGTNIIFKLQAEGIDLVHLGDLGHLPTARQVEQIGHVDILLIPVGGTYTIDAQEATQVVELLQPRVVIPMHYDTAALSFSLAPVEAFTVQYDCVIKKSFLELNKNELQGDRRIIVLDYLSS
jgi:L-ascorbate metabolism protein UlaG (beta-lactamase superfamily)